MENASKTSKNFKLFYAAVRSFGDISNDAMFQDIYIIMIGVFIMTLYVQFVISKFNWLEARVCHSSLIRCEIKTIFLVIAWRCWFAICRNGFYCRLRNLLCIRYSIWPSTHVTAILVDGIRLKIQRFYYIGDILI